jgi:RNA polymerase sigma-70 factor (ECF subfamily)
MASAVLVQQAQREDWSDEEVVRRVLDGETALYELLMRRHNQRLYRAARARIAVHEALTRSRRRLRFQAFDPADESNGEIMQSPPSTARSPEQQAYDRELAVVLEKAVSSLSEDHRLVFMLRDVEGMTTEETANCLNLTEENVKVRLHRARAGLRKRLYRVVGASAARCFQFHAVRCDRVVKNVFATLGIAAAHLD